MRTNTNSNAAPPSPPSEGLRQVRFLPDPLHRVSDVIRTYIRPAITNTGIQRRSAAPCQHGPGSTEYGREEEGLLKTGRHREKPKGKVKQKTENTKKKRSTEFSRLYARDMIFMGLGLVRPL